MQKIIVYAKADSLSQDELHREVNGLVGYIVKSYLYGNPRTITFEQKNKKSFELCAIVGPNFNPKDLNEQNKLQVSVVMY